MTLGFGWKLHPWPPQPPAENVPKLHTIVGFWQSMPHWETSIGNFVARLMATSCSVSFFREWGCWGYWGHWGCWGCRGRWGCKGSEAWKITTDECRVFQVPKFSFILMFWKQIFFVRILKYQVEFWHLLRWRLLRPAYGNFVKTGRWNSNVQISLSHWTP